MTCRCGAWSEIELVEVSRARTVVAAVALVLAAVDVLSRGAAGRATVHDPPGRPCESPNFQKAAAWPPAA